MFHNHLSKLVGEGAVQGDLAASFFYMDVTKLDINSVVHSSTACRR